MMSTLSHFHDITAVVNRHIYMCCLDLEIRCQMYLTRIVKIM